MRHLRQEIRERVRGVLSAIPGIYGSITFDSAEIPEALESPWCFVWLGDEQADPFTLGGPSGRKLQRNAPLYTDLMGRSTASALDELEGVAAEIEARIFASGRLAGLLGDCTYQGMQITRDTSGSQPICRLRLIWEITYTTTEADPSAAA